jgi:uncharacterized glyoxalase superfamily protein PhnB
MMVGAGTVFVVTDIAKSTEHYRNVFVRDVDAVYAELAARGARIVKPPQNYDCGMRDFDPIDLDGNQLTFATGRRPDQRSASGQQLMCGK